MKGRRTARRWSRLGIAAVLISLPLSTYGWFTSERPVLAVGSVIDLIGVVLLAASIRLTRKLSAR